MGERIRVDLSNLSGGAANDYFADAMKKVLANIEDINTPAKAVRGITLTLKIKPSEDRLTAETEINVSTKLAAVKPHSKSMFFSRDENGEGEPRFALFEADGGAWRAAAKKKIKDYIKEHVTNKEFVVLA